MTKRELIYDIITIAKKANYTDDDSLQEAYIGYKIDEKRSKEIRDSYKRNHMIDPMWVQDYGVVDLTIVNKADDKSFNYLDCVMSKVDLPPVVSIINQMSSANNLGNYQMRSVNAREEFYFMGYGPIMDLLKLSKHHPRRMFKNYTKISNSIFIPDGPKKIHPFLILERPLDGYINDTTNKLSGELVVGESYIVMDKQIIHDGVAYVKDKVFVATATTFTGKGSIQLDNQKRRMTDEDEYPMSSTMAEIIIIKILTEELKIQASAIADIRNNSVETLKVLQPSNE